MTPNGTPPDNIAANLMGGAPAVLPGRDGILLDLRVSYRIRMFDTAAPEPADIHQLKTNLGGVDVLQ